MKLGITGAQGLIGWHIRAFCRAYRPQIEIRLADRTTFASADALQQFAQGLDAIIHCAGVNRGTDEEIAKGNPAIVRQLAEACANTPFPHIVYTNSIHSRSDSIYGNSKRQAAEILQEAATHHQGKFTNLILPHVFGEFGKPFYNSVVSTFCHQLAQGETPTILNDSTLHLAHAQTIAAQCLQAIEENQTGEKVLGGEAISVSALLAQLQALYTSYCQNLTIPNLESPLTLALFNTLRSYVFPERSPVQLTLRSDNRGHLFEAVKTLQGGQTFLSTTHPGITRGNHFHTHKVERFLVCAGEAEIRIRKLFSDKIERFTVSGEHPSYIDMPCFHTHSITNTGKGELVTLFWANEIFDPANPDTFSEMV